MAKEMGNQVNLLEAKGIYKVYETKVVLLGKGLQVKAVEGVDLVLEDGVVYGLVGESGCGKTTLGQILVGLIPPSKGEVYYKGKKVFPSKDRLDKETRAEIQMIFQDPYSSLNPKMSIGRALDEALKQKGIERSHRIERALELLRQVGLSQEHYYSYPHQLSGGQRQRVVIARALAMEPKVIVCDEPVSSLDVLIQAQILNLLMELKDQHHLTYLFISHDLNVVAHISDRIGVMYRGQIVEEGPADLLYQQPLHPYTNLLLNSIPGSSSLPLTLYQGIKRAANHDHGCKFYPRCPFGKEICLMDIQLMDVDGKRKVRCVNPDSFLY